MNQVFPSHKQSYTPHPTIENDGSRNGGPDGHPGSNMHFPHLSDGGCDGHYSAPGEGDGSPLNVPHGTGSDSFSSSESERRHRHD